MANDKDINQHLEDVKSNLKALLNSIIDLTSELVSEFQGAAKNLWEDSDNWWYNPMNNWHPKIEVITESESKDELPFPFWRHRSFDHPFFKAPWTSNFGLSAFGTPSIRQYNTCLEKKGAQVYDSSGHWKCLFPRSEVPNDILNCKDQRFPDEILTKEDLDRELQNKGFEDGKLDLGSRGILFKQYEDFMNWKSLMYKNMKEERRRRRQEWLQHFEKQVKSNYGKEQTNGDHTTVSTSTMPETDSKQVVSVSSEISYSYSGDEAVYKENKTEFFNDGTSKTSTITKTKPPGEHWQVQESDKNGWFWK